MSNFKFIDLFAGIGGFHLSMESLGGECVFASEIDPFARKTYEHNFKKINPELFNKGMFNDDIRKINPVELPDFDILCAGFPCQPFSQAGHKRGFNDTHKSERGNLFFNIVEILESKNPKAFFLENVRGLVGHDNGNTFKVIRDIIENELGYSFHYKIIKASDYGLPQLRPRTFMIGFRNESKLSSFSFPPEIPLKFTMSDVWGGECSREIGFTLRVGGRGSNINDRRNWDSYLVDGEVKKIMPEQAKKMQGFPEWFEFPVSTTQAMKQLGNSVAIDAIKACGRAMVEHLKTLEDEEDNMVHTVLDINNNNVSKMDENLGIKAYLKNNPTLLNTSGNTNFIFEVLGLNTHDIDSINSINSNTTVKDRIEKIYILGGELKFRKIENESMQHNLSMVDSLIPEIISTMLLEFYLNGTNSISDNLNQIYSSGIFNTDLTSLQKKVKKLLLSILLDSFSGIELDDENIKNHPIIAKTATKQVEFDITEKVNLENYLFENIKFDSPPTSRYRFGSLIMENNGNTYFKLNMRFKL